MALFSFSDIRKPSVVEILSLPRLFHEAMKGDFSFYGATVKKAIRMGFMTEGVLKKHWWNRDFHIMGKLL